MTRENIISELNKRGYEAEAKEVVKNGVVCKGIVLKSEDLFAPVIYTDRLIEEAEEEGWSLEEVLEDVIGLYEESRDVKFSVKDIFNRDYIMNNIYVGLQKTSNDDICKEDSGFEGIEAYLYVRGAYEDDGAYTIKVNRAYLDRVDLEEEQVWIKAKSNTINESVMKSMARMMCELTGMPYDDSLELGLPIYVVTNREKIKGASAILNRALIEKVAEAYGVSQVIALPSSVHEMLLIPYDPDTDIDELSDMIRQINTTEVAPDDRLSDRAYLIEV